MADSEHVHVFSHAVGDSPSNVVAAVAELENTGVRFIGQFIGSFQVYAHFEVPSLADAQQLVDDLWPAGLRTEMSTEVKVGILGPKRASPEFCALVRVTPDVDPGSLLDALDEKFGRLGDPDYHYGAAVVTGRGYDLLVDLGRPSFDLLKSAVLEDLRTVDGIGRTDTSWADLSKNSFRNY
jgi:hypothetical protein